MSNPVNVLFDHVADVRTGGGKHRSVLAGILDALTDARIARAEYQRQISHGIEPSEAVRAAFDVAGK
jgi:hypothetical protein